MIKYHAPAERHRVVVDHLSCVHGGIPLLASEVLFCDHHSFADEVGRGAGWNVGAEPVPAVAAWHRPLDCLSELELTGGFA
jgi:hypothetical protein